MNNIGGTLYQLNQPQLAIAFMKNSVNTYEDIRKDSTGLPLEQQDSYNETIAETYRTLANLLIDQGRFLEAQAVLELLKLQELQQFTRDVGIDSPGINLSHVEEKALAQIISQYKTLGNFALKIAQCEQASCPENLAQLQAQRDQLYETVTQELQAQSAVLTQYYSTERATLSPEKLNTEARRIVNAQPGTLLIYPLVLKDKLQFLVGVKTGTGSITFRPFESSITAEQLFKTIQTFRTQLSETRSGHPTTDLKTVQATSEKLYNWLIKPLESELKVKGVKHLVFAPDSTTRYIPLAALYDGEQYLIERFTVTTITAASETDTQEKVPQPTSRDPILLAMGASDFKGFAPLLNVPEELNIIAKTSDPKDTQGVYPGSEFLNTAFNFEALKQHLSSHKILHLATHGKFQPGKPEDSYLVPGTGDNLTTARIDQLGNYGLSNIHLVVLSACETAVGDRASDGIEIPGISHFFLKNDVKSVLASLWSVNDSSTSLLMQNFYKQLQTQTKAEALQQVQIQFIQNGLASNSNSDDRGGLKKSANPIRANPSSEEFRHPYYWAPFILIGNSL